MIWNSIFLAFRSIRRNALRSFLTILGIVIGVAAVITMVTVGNGATMKIKTDISKLGSNLLMIRPGQMRGPGGGSEGAPPFDDKDVRAIAREIRNLEAVAPSCSKSMTAISGNSNWTTSVIGTHNDYFKVRDWEIEKGREFSDSELHSGRAVCIIGATVIKELFGGKEPIGEKIRLQKISFEIIGTLVSKGQTGLGQDQDDQVIIPLRTFQRRISGNTNIASIQVSVLEGYSTQNAADDIERLLRERRRIAPSETDNFSVRDMSEIADTLSSTTKVMTSLLGAVAAVSLLVGGIGIMNIMLVSVTERTREIGTRLAIGALEKDVLTQFLVEAIVLASFGGLFGIALAVLASAGLAKLLNVPLILNMNIIISAFLFSGGIGVIFGFFPARKAARLNPIDALRHE